MQRGLRNFPKNRIPDAKYLKPTYYSYVALLTQSSTNPPTAVVLKNDFIGEMVYTYGSTGEYSLENEAQPFTQNKTYVMVDQTSYALGTNRETLADWAGPNVISIKTAKGGGPEDGVLLNSTLEVRVYY